MTKIAFPMFCILVSVSAFIKTEYQDNVKSLTSCVVKIVEGIDLKKYSNFMDITVMNMNNDLELSALHAMKSLRFISRRFFWDTENISNVMYIVMSEDYEELERGLRKVTSDTFWNPSARFIIVLQNYENYNLYDVVDLLHAYNIFYKVSFISREGDDYAIYKFNLTTPGYCIKSGHLKFWSWCSEYRSEKSLPILLYRGGIRNCHFKFITRNIWPFVNFDTNTKGIEQYLMKLFQKHEGANIDFIEFGKLDRYGNIADNIAKIMLSKVENNEVEGAIGGYSINSEYSGNYSHIYPMTIDHMYFILANADYLGQWSAVLYQSLTTCVLVGLLFVIFSIAATLLSIFPTREKDISHNVLVVFGYLLNKNVVKNTQSGWPQTLVFSSLLFLALIIPYAIQANLFSVTTQPVRGYELEEPEELTNLRPILFTGWPFEYHDFEGYLDCGSSLNCLMQVKNSSQTSFYTVVSDSQYQVNSWQLTDHQCNMAVYRLKEPYVTILRTVFLRRGSALMHPLNYFLLRVATTGLLHKYSSDIYFRERLRCKSLYRPTHMPLTLQNFHYIFLILIVGYCLSILIFINEIRVGSQSIVKVNT